MTEKLYYSDAYLAEFDARIISVKCEGEGFVAVLDKTAFFPEEGGQSADSGYIGEARVLDVKEKGDAIYHYLDRDPGAAEVHCKLDFDKRFEKMQCHTAEHILCGIIHKLYGYENVGFHLGDDVVTFDVDGELDAEEIARVELLANRAVFENREVTASFPSADEARELEYRSKLDITENLRIVDIDGVDKCACCAPHVRATGEIGAIKIVDFMRHRGGMRLFMQAGYRALSDYTARYTITRAIGAMTSTPSLEILDSVKKLAAERDKLAAELAAADMRYAACAAETVATTGANAVYVLDCAAIDTLREFSNRALPKIGGILVVLSGDEGNYRYVISSATTDLRVAAREINAALRGKGGGRPEMITGSFAATLGEIRAYFEK